MNDWLKRAKERMKRTRLPSTEDCKDLRRAIAEIERLRATSGADSSGKKATKKTLLAAKTIRRRRKEIFDTMRRLREELNQLPERCPHEDVTFNPDPAGGSDSYYHCHDCGAESRRGFDRGDRQT